MKEKVLVGMSGGVDSSVCAYLLQQQGYEVEGVFLHLWDDDSSCRRAGHVGCCGSDAVEDARAVCSLLSVPLHVVSMKDEFRKDVVDYFCRSYIRGCTPNPCIECNRLIKWRGMLETASRRGARYVATGHYASIIKKENGRYALLRAANQKKDQTYVLYTLTQEQLSHTLFPLGDYKKESVRKIASDAGIPVAEKRDSQDICFVPEGDHGAFIRNEVGDHVFKEGDFVLSDNTVVGRHRGIAYYTYGQRKGLGISLGEPVFVTGIDAEKNEVVLGRDGECYSSFLEADRVNHLSTERFDENREYIAKIRYSHTGSRCRVRYLGDAGERIRVDFEEPVRAITPGQAVVIYDKDEVAGGGVIL